MKRMLIALAATTAAFAVAPAANAAALLPNTTGQTINAFNAATQGTLLDSFAVNAGSMVSPGTYTANYRVAIYRNTLGTIDFYYQLAVNQILPQDEINAVTMFNFANYDVEAFFSTADLDGAGTVFTAAANPNSDGAGGTSLGFTSTAERNGSGATVRINFGLNGLEAAGETSAIYILRTNALTAGRGGSFTSQDGSTVTVSAFQAVPEPATWGMMLLGFGAMGYAMRRRQRAAVRFA